jgi:hypothetical protein
MAWEGHNMNILSIIFCFRCYYRHTHTYMSIVQFHSCLEIANLKLGCNLNNYHHHHHHHHHNISVMELGQLLTRSGFTYPEVSSKVCHDSFCRLGNSVSLPWVIYYGVFYLHVVSSFFYIPVIFLKLVLFLIPLQFMHLFCNQSKCILLFFSCVSSLLLLFFWSPLL